MVYKWVPENLILGRQPCDGSRNTPIIEILQGSRNTPSHVMLHFLVSCPGYQEKRKSLFERLSREFKIPIAKMSTENIFLLLLNPPSNNIELQKIIAKYVHECYEIRKKVNSQL